MLSCGPQFIAACRRRYGTAFTLRVASMGTVVYLTDPADIKTVFSGDPRVYHAGEANSMLRGLLGDTSVLVVDGDVHRDRRRLMLAPFAREAVAAQVDLIAQIAADNIAGWPCGRRAWNCLAGLRHNQANQFDGVRRRPVRTGPR